jgi:uncharacterized membrane protein YccF (DUF307 family)
MFEKKRIVVTLVFLGAVAMTLISAFVFKRAVLVLVFILIQYAAWFWYSLSYVPYGRKMACVCFKKATNREG